MEKQNGEMEKENEEMKKQYAQQLAQGQEIIIRLSITEQSLCLEAGCPGRAYLYRKIHSHRSDALVQSTLY